MAEAEASAESAYELYEAGSAPLPASLVIGGCHQLVYADGGLLGDPMEKAAIRAAGWSYHADATCSRIRPLASPTIQATLPPSAIAIPTLKIQRRFPFSSDLKRSSTIVEASLRVSPEQMNTARAAAVAAASGCHGLYVLAKGSPEMIRELLAAVPDGYDAAHQRHSLRGKRVIALASKPLGVGVDWREAQRLQRDEAEAGLTFCGFLVLHCPPKPESERVLRELANSGHALQMLTGDSLLTAVHAAHTLGLSTRPPLLLQVERPAAPATQPLAPPLRGGREPIESYIQAKMATAGPPAVASVAKAAAAPSVASPVLRWSAWMGSATAAAQPLPQPELSARAFETLAAKFDLCVGGDGFAVLQAAGALPAALPHLRVLARVSPNQKELALSTLRDAGYVTMMCGDGTNDVGALKQSAVGVALVSTSLVAPPPPPPPPEAEGGGYGVRQRKGAGAADEGRERSLTPREKQQKRMEARLSQEMQTLPSVKLGDASIAAAFTAKSASVTSCVDIITQGRCTLVTTTQMFKILALNCLVSAYGLSVMHLRGVRMSDAQAMATGLGTAALFLFVSFAQPLSKLAPQRPPPSVLSPSVLLSVVCQFATHLHALSGGLELGERVEAAAGGALPPEVDADFEPSMTNTVVYLLSSSMLLCTFAVNYTGKPFMEALSANKGLMASLVLSSAVLVMLALGLLPDVAELLELVDLPEETGARSEMLNLMLLDFGGCLVIAKSIERIARALSRR